MPFHGMRVAGQESGAAGGGMMPQMEAASQPAVMPEEPMIPEMPIEAPVGPAESKVSQTVARYLGPEYRCAGCIHFMEGSDTVGECMIVDGPISPDGVCSLFEPDTDAMASDETAIPSESAEMTDMTMSMDQEPEEA